MAHQRKDINLMCQASATCALTCSQRDKDIDTSSDQILQIPKTLESVQGAEKQATYMQINLVKQHVDHTNCEHHAMP